MKKTIAKIMAAAMVLSTIAAPNVLAASVFTGVTDYSKFPVQELYVDGYKANDENAESVYVDINNTDMADLADATKSNTFDDSTEVANITVGANVEYAGAANIAQITSNNAVTAGTTDSAKHLKYTDDAQDIYNLLANGTTVSKEVVASGNGIFKDVTVLRNVDYTEWARMNLTNVGGRWVRTYTLDRTYANHYELVRQMLAGNSLRVRTRVYINGVATRFWVWRSFRSTTNFVENDEYWNAIVKLKASNNRYTPIRVHVDVVDGSIAALNGALAVSIVNRTNIQPWGIATIGTNGLVTANSLASNRLILQDVQVNDLALLKSDYAKGKNLMLDEAYVFDVTGVWNNNSLNGAGAQIFDYITFGQDLSYDTVKIGNIQDIRSGLFKKCKEKLVHAKNVKWIRNGAFRENKQLKKAILSDDVSMKKINEKSFYKCKKLNTVKVKVNTLKHVGKNAFGDSTDKKSLKFNLKAGSKAKYNKAVKLFKKSGVKKAKFRKI